MKAKYGSGLSQIDLPINLKVLLKNNINTIITFSGENLLNIDKSVHEIRRSLKAILAILLLFKVQFDRVQYLNWKSYFQSFLKQFAASRESFVFLQTLKKIENELKELNEIQFNELRNHLEIAYRLLVKENIKLKEVIGKLNGSIIKISATINNSSVYSDLRSLKNSYKKTFQKTKQWFKKLTLDSSMEDFHKFRKWCKFFYFQQIVLLNLDLEKVSLKENKKILKLSEFLGDEHDLQVLLQYLRINFTDLYEKAKPILLLKIKILRKKVLLLYPKIYS